MNHSEKLEMLATLTARSGMDQADFHDMRRWCDLAGPKFDVSVLCDKTLERIASLYDKFFWY